MTAPSQARIVYTQANIVLKNDGQIPIDLNNDGITDFIVNQNVDYQGCVSAYANVSPNMGAGVIYGAVYLQVPWASALNAGVIVGSAQPFSSTYAILTDVLAGFGCPFQHDYGLWGNAGPHYVGVMFTKNHKLHYGWVELNVLFANCQRAHYMTTTLSGYAYETIAGKAIVSGKS